MKKIIKSLGVGTVIYIIAGVAAILMTVLGLYFIDEVWYYELESSIVWAAGTVGVVFAIKAIGEKFMLEENQKKLMEEMKDM